MNNDSLVYTGTCTSRHAALFHWPRTTVYEHWVGCNFSEFIPVLVENETGDGSRFLFIEAILINFVSADLHLLELSHAEAVSGGSIN